MKKTVLTLSTFTLLAFAVPASATGLYECESGERSNWKSKEELETKMKADGWTVRRIKEDGGCYEVYGLSLIHI